GFAGCAVGVREERRLLVLHDIGIELVALLPGVHRVEDIAGVGLEPPQRRDSLVARQEADASAERGLPAEGWLAAHRALQAAGERQYRKQNMAIGDAEIVHHA